eukprot:3851367-Rhodomonas_salina.1
MLQPRVIHPPSSFRRLCSAITCEHRKPSTASASHLRTLAWPEILSSVLGGTRGREEGEEIAEEGVGRGGEERVDGSGSREQDARA